MSFIERAAGLVVYRKVGGIVEYLLLQASYKPFHWTPPKGIAIFQLHFISKRLGHVDPGEDEWTAALRETEEEAGIKKDQLVIHEDCHETMSYNVITSSVFIFPLQVAKRGEPSHMVPKTVKYWLAGLKDKNEVLLSHEHQV